MDDEVVLRLGGREVFHQPHVKTRMQLGLAANYEAPVAAGPVSFELSLPRRNLELRLPLQINQDTYIGVSVTREGELRHVIAHEPFGYV